MHPAKLIPLLATLMVAHLAGAASLQYFRVGSATDLQVVSAPGVAMMGGGKDLDEAFRWLGQKANGGDFLILRASGSDAYNPYVNGLCRLNSVATLVIPDRQSAQDPVVAGRIREAAAVFISGGDQARYVRAWMGTPVQEAINADVAAGKPIGGTSAGLAVLGEFVYGALADDPDGSDLMSADVLRNPYLERVTLVRGLLRIPLLRDTLTDSHFGKRDRMGRSLGFLARVMEDGWSSSPREVAIDERSAFLVEADGKGTVVGSGRGVYFIRPSRKPSVCRKNEPLSFEKVRVYRVPSGGHFDLRSWRGQGGVKYSLLVRSGEIQSTQAEHAVY